MSEVRSSFADYPGRNGRIISRVRVYTVKSNTQQDGGEGGEKRGGKKKRKSERKRKRKRQIYMQVQMYDKKIYLPSQLAPVGVAHGESSSVNPA